MTHFFRHTQLLLIALFALLSIAPRSQAAVQYSTTQDWGSGFNGQVTLTNTGTQAQTGWTLQFDLNRNITSIWDATIVSHIGTRYTVKATPSNNTIPAKGQISFGFGGAPGNLTTGPSNFAFTSTPVITATPTPVPTTAPSVAKYETTEDWGGGFNGKITINNTQSQPLTNWALSFTLDRNITSIWDAKVVSHVGTRYTVKSVGWNDTIPAKSQISFGFGGTPGNITTGPSNFVLTGTSIGPTPTPAPTATPVPTPKPTATPSPTPQPTPCVTPTPVPNGVTASIIQTGRWNGGFGANIEIANGTQQTIQGWTLRFDFMPEITSLWNGTMTKTGDTYSVKNLDWNATIAPGAKVTLGFSANSELFADSASNGLFNGATCPLTVVLGGSGPGGGSSSAIVIGGADSPREALQITIPQGNTSFPLSLTKGGATTFTVACNNPSVVSASIAGDDLQLTGLQAGRAGLRIQESGGAVRYVGVRVRTATGGLPGFPNRLALGSVSEDTDDHLDFWHAFDSGLKNRYVDARYIYLNGGPQYGWATWGNTPGGRASNYIRESKKMGMIPIFVWYNIPDGGESYTTDLEHIQSVSYMREYYKLLKLFLDIVKAESPDEPVGIILEPDFLGYMAQNSGKSAAQISAFTSAAYDVGLLKQGVDPTFPNTVQGLVKSINYIINRDTPQSVFGWQMNLWASPAGGWTTPIPGTGLMHLTDKTDIATGRQKIDAEASAITQYYLNAGVTSYGADFLSIDKYGLDAASAEASAATDPAASTWFWNLDQWNNYLVFVKAMHETSGLPVWLWQLPVGHINTSKALNPYNANKPFPNLINSDRQGEDSAPTFFFGDDFVTTGKRYDFFSQNRGNDPGAYKSDGGLISWGEHFTAASQSGVSVALFGAGVGASTTNVGSPPTDSLWWIVKAQKYLSRPAPLNAR